jgi:hypothetical protein
MAAGITRGTTFTLGQQNVDVATFKPVLTSATIINIDRDNVDITAASVVTQASSAISNPQSKELWQESQHNYISSYVSSAWAPAISGGRAYTLDSNSVAVVPGDLLMPSTTVFPSVPAAGTLMKAATGLKYSWMAVATAAVAAGSAGVAIYHGVAKVRSTGTINAGEAVRPSSTDGVVESAGAAGNGYGPTILGVALEAATGGYVWIHLRR